MTFEQLVAKSIEHADAATRWVNHEHPDPGTSAAAQVHATLSEAYARLASAVIVNRTSLQAVLGPAPKPPRDRSVS